MNRRARGKIGFLPEKNHVVYSKIYLYMVTLAVLINCELEKGKELRW